jgi:hypothetical protein
MTDFVTPNDFTEKTKAKAVEVNENFTAIETHLNTTGVHKFQNGNYGALNAASSLFSIDYQTAAASGDLNIGTSAGDIAGATITVTETGTYVCLGIFDFQVEAGTTIPSTCLAIGTCVVNGSTQAGSAQLLAKTAASGASNAVRANVSQFWVVTPSATQVVKLQATRADTGSGGVATAYGSHSRLIVVRLI